MKPVDRTEPAQSETLWFEIDLHHPPAKVWRALTDAELLEAWLLPVLGFDLEPGTTFTFQAPPQPGWDGTVHCRLLESEEDHLLRYAWKVGDLDTVVTFTLTPTGSGTRLSIVQSGFSPDQKRNFGGARYGWRMMGARLVEVLAGTL